MPVKPFIFCNFRIVRCLILFALVVSQTVLATSQNLDKNWTYRWGDSPFVDGKPQWIMEPDHSDWQSIAFPSNPPDRNGATNVWYRTEIPEGHWHEPVLYIFSVDLIVQVYLEDKLIHQYGAFDDRGQGAFSGWPWHMIALPQDAAGKPIFFRIFSNYLDIGLWGEVKIMERLELYQMIWQRSAENLVITGFTLFIALLSTLFAVQKGRRLVFFPLALFSLASAGLAFTSTQAKQLIWLQPLFWDYVAAASYYLLPVGLILLLSRGFRLIKGAVSSGLEAVFIIYFVGAIGLSLMGVVSLSDTYPLFDVIFAVLVPLALVLALRYRPLTFDQGLLLFASLLITGLLILDMLVAHNFIDWSRVPIGWGSLTFSLVIVVLAVRQFMETQNQLAELNHSLEARVKERTEELNRIASMEAYRATALLFIHKRSEDLNQFVSALSQYQHIETALDFLRLKVADLIDPIPFVIYWFEDGLFKRDLHPAIDPLILTQHFPDQFSGEGTDLKSPSDFWKCYRLHYQLPDMGKQPVALIWAETSGQQDEILGIESLTLDTLLERGVDRLSFTLSQIALKSTLSSLSFEDGLTGLHNRRYLDSAMSRMVQVAIETSSALSVIICDIDYFKKVNDTYGHMAGDEVLRQVGIEIKRQFHRDALLCRFGGEEFVIVLPGKNSQQAYQDMERLRESITQLEIQFDGLTLRKISLSAGICCLESLSRRKTAELLIQYADKALYHAKNSGRNQTVLYESILSTQD